MRRFCLPVVLAVGIAMLASLGLAQQATTTGPYKLLKTVKVGGDGGFDYVNADVVGRRLYVPRSGPTARITVFDLDTLEPAGEVPNVSGHGAVVDPKTNHGFVTSNPVVMFDSKTLAVIKTIAVQGNPDGILFDPFNERVYDLSHSAPYATVIDAKDGSIVGTIDLGGAPEQAVTDGKGHVYVDIEDKGNVAVVDAKTLAVTAHYDVSGKAGTCAGLAIDAKNRVLFVACRDSAHDGDSQRRRRQHHHHAAAQRRHRWRRVQPRYDGSLQLARRRHAGRDQGKQPHQLRGGTEL